MQVFCIFELLDFFRVTDLTKASSVFRLPGFGKLVVFFSPFNFLKSSSLGEFLYFVRTICRLKLIRNLSFFDFVKLRYLLQFSGVCGFFRFFEVVRRFKFFRFFQFARRFKFFRFFEVFCLFNAFRLFEFFDLTDTFKRLGITRSIVLGPDLAPFGFANLPGSLVVRRNRLRFLRLVFLRTGPGKSLGHSLTEREEDPFKHCLKMLHVEVAGALITATSENLDYFVPSLFNEFIEFLPFFRTYSANTAFDLPC